MMPLIKLLRNTLSKGILYIIPVPISDETLSRVLPEYNREIIKPLRVFVVEKLKTARQYLRKLDPSFPIDDCTFFEQDKHASYNFDPDLIKLLSSGVSVGLMSESGYPGIADPGSRVVSLAHIQGCRVVPLVGPSSLFMALAASGMNGQGFTFYGYLPKSGADRIKKLRELVSQIQRTSFAQLFIETPYRNKLLFDELIANVPGDIKLCIAYDITGIEEKVITRKISEWKNVPFEFDKLPCVFVLGTS